MIRYLHLENFVKHKDLELNFEKGMTAIVGRNGGGKSLIQEAIRFALFGTSALRGKIENYDKKLKVTAELTINGENYTIIRTLKDCTFGNVVGTTACNKAIEQALGFDMSVFDMGCCAKQFEITRLGDMKPTERKQAVDKLIGIDTLELLRKDIKQNISELRGRKEGLERYMTVPVEPTRPENYQPSSEISTILQEARRVKQLLSEKTAVWSTLPNEMPTPLSVVELPQPKGSYELAVRKQTLTTQLKGVELSRIVEGPFEEELERVIAWKNYSDLQEPNMSKDEIARLEKEWQDYRNWLSAKKAKCPKCGEEFAVSGEKECKMPETPYEKIQQEKDLIYKWERRPTCDKPTMGKTETELRSLIAQRDRALREKEWVDGIQSELDKIGECGSVFEWTDYNRATSLLQTLQLDYERKKADYERGCVLLKEIATLSEERNKYNIEELETNLMAFHEYEVRFAKYEVEKKHYDELSTELDVVTSELERYKLADEGITNLKAKVKLYVIPSLQKVATDLVREMSAGEINEVNITDEFEISLDGKELNLLSGSEKAIANLAIRLGLGCVLTHKVFNVFMGDEIDEAMSEERASMVADSLRRLLGQIDQIILISHKQISADRYISVDT